VEPKRFSKRVIFAETAKMWFGYSSFYVIA